MVTVLLFFVFFIIKGVDGFFKCILPKHERVNTARSHYHKAQRVSSVKYTSTNVFSDFEFHDAFFKLEHYVDNTLTVSVKYLNIHKNVGQNPHPTDMEIDVARLTFHNFRVILFDPGRNFKQDENGKWYTDDPQILFTGETAETKLLQELFSGATVFEFGITENQHFYFDGSGTEMWFHVEFRMDSATVQWDTFRGPAWYEKPPFQH